MYLSKIIWICLFVHCHARSHNSKPRDKRTIPILLYGPFGVLQFILGYGTPVPDLLRPSTTLGYFMRGVYAVPHENASEYLPIIPEISRSISRWDIYDALEKDSEIRGHGGRNCVLRAICQAAEVPLDKYHGFFEEMFYEVFKPKMTNEPIRSHGDNEYLAAHDLGAEQGRCEELFPDCKVTFLDLFTHLFTNFNND